MELKFSGKHPYKPTPARRPLREDGKENREKPNGLCKTTTDAPFKRFIIDDGEFRSGHPLRNICIAIDIENRNAATSLQTEFQKLGGKVVLSINDEPSPVLLVSDHPLAEKLETLTNPLKQLDEKKLRSLPPIFRNAWKLGIRVRSKNSFEKILDSIKDRTRVAVKKKYGDGGEQQASIVGPLKWPYVKIDFDPDVQPASSSQKTPSTMCYQPAFEEFGNDEFLTIYFGNDAGESFFEQRKPLPEPLIPPPLEPILNQTFEELNDSGCSKAFLTEGSEKEVHCELCNIKLSPSKKEQHYASVPHVTRTLAPATYSAFDEFLGVREDFAEMINLPSGVAKRVWRQPEKETKQWKEVNDFDRWLQKMASGNSSDSENTNNELDDLRRMLNSPRPEVSSNTAGTSRRGDSHLDSSHNSNPTLEQSKADKKNCFPGKFSTPNVSHKLEEPENEWSPRSTSTSEEEKPSKFLSPESSDFLININEFTRRAHQNILEKSDGTNFSQIMNTLRSVDDLMQYANKSLKEAEAEQKDSYLKILEDQGSLEVLDEISSFVARKISGLEETCLNSSNSAEIDSECQKIENESIAEQVQKNPTSIEDHPSRLEPDFDLYKEFLFD